LCHYAASASEIRYSLPEPLDTVGIESSIDTDNPHILDQSLCDDDTVEWIAMVERQPNNLMAIR
jgi:hypothetical protein